MKRFLIAAIAAGALAVAATASAALEPSVYDPGNTGCVTSSYSHGVLHLAKNCPTSTNAAAQANITGLTGQTFQSASFTLANATQCQGGSPRFDITTTNGLFYLGCNNVTPTVNQDGTVTYTFTAATLAAAGQQVPTPTGTITAVDVLIDVSGTADVSQITVNGVLQVPTPTTPTSKNACKHGGWKHFSSPTFKNQGKCVSYFNHALHASKHHK